MIVPVELDGRKEASGDEVIFSFREGVKCPAIISFIKRELKLGLPPVYVALTPEGLRVVGVNDEASAVKEVIKAVEELRSKAVKAAGELESAKGLGEESTEEHAAAKGIFSPLKKLRKH